MPPRHYQSCSGLNTASNPLQRTAPACTTPCNGNTDGRSWASCWTWARTLTARSIRARLANTLRIVGSMRGASYQGRRAAMAM